MDPSVKATDPPKGKERCALHGFPCRRPSRPLVWVGFVAFLETCQAVPASGNANPMSGSGVYPLLRYSPVQAATEDRNHLRFLRLREAALEPARLAALDSKSSTDSTR